MALWQILLGASVLLSIDCVLEMALVSGLVAYVHGQNSAFYTIEDNGSTFNLQSRAGQFTEDGGHLSNAAGGIGFFLGLWGIYMALRLKKSQTGRETFPKFIAFQTIHLAFLVFNVLAVCMSLAALAMVFAVTHMLQHHIDLSVARAAAEANERYPVGTWTPGNWYAQLLTLNIVPSSDRGRITGALKIMDAGYYNLIPMFVIAFGYCALNVFIFMSERRRPSSKGSSQVDAIKEVDESVPVKE